MNRDKSIKKYLCIFNYLEDYILNLFNNNIIIEETLDSNIYLLNAVYYLYEKEFNKMDYYYSKSIEMNCRYASENTCCQFQLHLGGCPRCFWQGDLVPTLHNSSN